MIDILLSTYNGYLYLNEQIDSIINQSYNCWRLLIRDDGSTDRTIDIIQKYRQIHPSKFYILRSQGQIGACQSFAELLKKSTADYVMFCDQDDVWLPDKIELTFKKMESLERNHPNRPVLVHTDLYVVERTLKNISNSMWSYANFDITTEKELYKIASQNIVTGCTMMINKSAKRVSLPIPMEAVMHDWWIAINVCKYGVIGHVDKQTILYRQHSNNCLGTKNKNKKYYAKKSLQILTFIKQNIDKYRMLRKLRFNIKIGTLLKNTIATLLKSILIGHRKS